MTPEQIVRALADVGEPDADDQEVISDLWAAAMRWRSGEGAEPEVRDAIAAARAYYAMPGNGAGGNLHLVLDDGNVEDSSVDCCLDCASAHGDAEGVRLAEQLRALTVTQRQAVYHGQ